MKPQTFLDLTKPRNEVHRTRVEVFFDMQRRVRLLLGSGRAQLEAATPSAAAPGSSLSRGNARGLCLQKPGHESGQRSVMLKII
jgi:hypothetical protein